MLRVSSPLRYWGQFLGVYPGIKSLARVSIRTMTFLPYRFSKMSIPVNRATLREINQMEREMCNYLDWELTVNNPVLGNFNVLKRSRYRFGSPAAKSMHTGLVGAAPPDQYPTQNLNYLGCSREVLQAFGAARCRTRAPDHVGPDVPPDRPPDPKPLIFREGVQAFGPPLSNTCTPSTSVPTPRRIRTRHKVCYLEDVQAVGPPAVEHVHAIHVRRVGADSLPDPGAHRRRAEGYGTGTSASSPVAGEEGKRPVLSVCMPGASRQCMRIQAPRSSTALRLRSSQLEEERNHPQARCAPRRCVRFRHPRPDLRPLLPPPPAAPNSTTTHTCEPSELTAALGPKPAYGRLYYHEQYRDVLPFASIDVGSELDAGAAQRVKNCHRMSVDSALEPPSRAVSYNSYADGYTSASSRGLYYKLQGPISMKSDIICKRSRHDTRRGGVSASVCEIWDDTYAYDEPDPDPDSESSHPYDS
ncbi:hypothetical protein B0H14DRAFT_3889240 [Mycena olivaceomarginata]|nr:hypothetical protein B0H14DRAFT_3889240 [Mycena olivaceomarginata]